jgi:uncharacterized protein YoaH (UPF0181 family)
MNFDAQSAREKFSELAKLAPDQQASMLAAPGAVSGLAYNGQAAQALALIETLAPDQQASVLAAPDAVWSLAHNGQAAQVLALIEKLAPGQQASALAAPDAVWSLAYKGQAAQALALIEKLAPDQQASVLAAPGAVSGLAYNGQREAVEKLRRGVAQWQSRVAKDDQSSDLNGQAAPALALIEKLTPEQQASVLAAPGAKEGLTDSGQGEAVERIERGMAQGQTRAAKDDQSSDLNGQAAQILALIEKLTPEQQVSVLATPGAVQGLAHKEQGEAVEKLRRDVAQWRTRVAKKDQSSDLER